MRVFRLLSSTLVLTAPFLAAAACGGHITVRSAIPPDARFTRLHNFEVLPARMSPASSSDAGSLAARRGTLHTIGFELMLAFQSRGYFADTASPDFAVAYYVTRRLPIDTAAFAYGYKYAPYDWWADDPKALAPQRPDSAGILVVDVINPKTMSILWRGQGVFRVTADDALYAKELRDAVHAVVDQFPGGVGVGPIAPRQVNHGGERPH